MERCHNILSFGTVFQTFWKICFIFVKCDIYDFGWSFSALQLSTCPKDLHKKNNNSVEGFSTKQEKF